MGDFGVLRGDGREAQVLARAFLLQDAQRNPVRLIGSMLDNTHQKELQARLKEGQRLMSMGAMVGGLANQTNNILAPILTAAEALEENPLLDEHQKGLVDIIRHNCLRGRDLMRRILDHTSGLDSAPHPVDIRPLVRNVLEMGQNTFPKNILLESDLAEDLPRPVAGDLDVQQALLGMCVHLRDCLPRGGRIRIQASGMTLDPQFTLQQNQAAPGPYLKVRVQAEGGGAGKAAPPAGLAAVSDLAAEAGGFLNAFTESDSARVLELYLPVGGEGAEAGAAEPRPAPAGNGETLLLVDDEPAFLDLCRKALEQNGYRVLQATHGAEAISLFFQHRADIALAIMDLDMPIMDGLTAIRTLRGIQPRLKVIASTGSLRKRADLKEEGVEVNGLLRKPYVVRDLLVEIDRPLR